LKFLIPNILTLTNLVLGIICIINIINQSNDFPILILFYTCLFLDFMDGFLARRLKVISEFGKQLDSLADLVSFAVLPTLALYFYLENISDNLIIKYIPVLIIIFSAIRLAKFNIDENNNNFFKGLPTPANALFFISLVYYDGAFKEYITLELVLILILIFSFLLVSKFKFISLKFSNFNFIKNLDRYIIILISFPTLYIYKDSYLFLLILFYVIYSVIKSFFSKLFFK